jgi:hypothetical protein
VSLVSLEGLGRVRLVVEATRDCRTTRVVATEVDAPEATVSGVILEPEPGAQWSWGRRRSLVGSLFDRNGRKVRWDPKRVVWHIDGTLVEAPTQLTAWEPQGPGTHTIELVYLAGEDRTDVLDKRTVSVSDQTPEEKEWVAAVAAFRQRDR